MVNKSTDEQRLAEIIRAFQDDKIAREMIAQIFAVIRQPRFTVKELIGLNKSITYRKINDWEERGLIKPHRDTTKSGWRRFSIVEATQILIIADLKAFGVSAEIIKKAFAELTTVRKSKTHYEPKYPDLELAVISATGGSAIYFGLKSNGVIIQKAESFIGKMIKDDIIDGVVAVIPFSRYVFHVMESIGTTIQKNPLRISKLLPKKTQKILEIIDNKSFEKITLVKANGEACRIIATSSKQGNFDIDDVKLSILSNDYQTVSIARKDGKNITIKQDLSIKL